MKTAPLPAIALIAMGAGALLAGCDAPPEAPAATAPVQATAAVRPVGTNLIGEQCRLQSDPRRTASLPILRGFRIHCGEWQQESGLVFETAAQPGMTGAINDYAAGGWWRESLAARMDCGDPRPVTILNGVPAAMLDCRLHGGGWNYVALATQVGGTVYLAEGIPAILPPIEASVAGLSGGFDGLVENLARRPRSAAIQDIEARLAGRLYGTGDLIDYRNLMEVAQYYNADKEFAKAEERYREALALHERLLGTDNPGRAYPLMHLALQLSDQGRFDVADDLFKRSESVLSPTDARERARLLSYRALHAANQREHEKAYQLAQASTDARAALVAQAPPPRRTGSSLFADRAFRQGGDVRAIGESTQVDTGTELPSPRRGALAEEAVSRYITAATQVELGRVPEAEANLREALRLIEEVKRKNDWLYPSVLMLRARIQADQGATSSAEATLREAIAAHQRLSSNSRDEALTWLMLARINAEAGRTADAFAAYDKAFAIVRERREGLELSLVQPYLDAAFAEARRQPDRAADLHRSMFTASQLVTGSITAQSIARTAVRFAAADPQRRQVIREWEAARQERDRLTRRFDALQSDPNAPPMGTARVQAELARAVETEREKDQLVQQAFPEYRQLADTPIGVADLIASLRSEEALVSVLLGESHAYVFFVGGGEIAVERSAMSLAEATRLVDGVRRSFEDEQALPHYDIALAHELYSRLLKPMEARMQGVRHLVTVPSGPLISVPFGILVTEPHPPVRNYDYSRVKFLAGNTAVSLSPAVASFVRLRTQAKPSTARNAFLGLGDAIPISDPERLIRGQNLPASCLDDARQLAQLPRLPGADQEVRAVADLFRSDGSAVRLGDAFSEAAMRQLPLQDYRVLFIATHALLPREIDCFVEPGLLTSLPREAAPTDNGLLEASEVRDLALDADLVVLSACNTGGAGTEKGGESLSGLARAFFGAGARMLLVSHWIVDNDATIALMRTTFADASVASGGTLAEALRRGQMAMIQGVEQSHPWYWGAFTVVGDGARAPTQVASLPR